MLPDLLSISSIPCCLLHISSICSYFYCKLLVICGGKYPSLKAGHLIRIHIPWGCPHLTSALKKHTCVSFTQLQTPKVMNSIFAVVQQVLLLVPGLMLSRQLKQWFQRIMSTRLNSLVAKLLLTHVPNLFYVAAPEWQEFVRCETAPVNHYSHGWRQTTGQNTELPSMLCFTLAKGNATDRHN